ncbi:MAG: DUF637 domain-containing protein [Alphaproteobacteria bacterium]|nr:DUF637 domain-containing protein [Alphaproteobacteria bacterium]
MAGAGTSAAFQALVTQASISLANNQGNIGKTLKDLGSSRSVRALVTAAGTAGLTYGLSNQLGVSAAGTSVGDHLQRSAIQTGVSTGFSIVSQDQSVGEALLQGAINIAASTAGGLGANTIGDWRDEGSIDALTHKVLHAGLGAGLGAASSLLDDPGKGALGGAIGGFFAELVAENTPSSMEPQTRADFGRAVGTVVAVAAGQDGNAALLAGTNAVMNNSLGHYSPDSEIAEQEMEGDKQAIVTLTTDIEPLAAISGHLHANVDRIHDAIEGIPYVGCIPSSTLQTFRMMRPVNHLAVSLVMPTTPLDVGLVGLTGVAGKALGATEKVATTVVKGGRKLISRFASKAAPVLTKAPGSKTVSALDLAVKDPAKKVVVPQVSVKSPAASSVKSSVEPPVKSVAKPAPIEASSTSVPKPSSSMQGASTSYGKSQRPTCSSSSRSPQAPSTAPPASSSAPVHLGTPGVKATQPASSSSQIQQNYRSGRGFQESVHASTRIPENKTAYSVLLHGKGEVSTIPDFPFPKTGVTEIKNVRYITFTEQLQAQATLARREGKSFNLVISPNTKRISKPVQKEIERSGGKIFEFNPTAEKWFERMIEGNIVLR